MTHEQSRPGPVEGKAGVAAVLHDQTVEGTRMAEVAPHHSDRTDRTSDSDIRLYHVGTECPIGRRIPPSRRVYGRVYGAGQSGYRLCRACEYLRLKGKC